MTRRFFIDLETTGLNPDKHQIIEVCLWEYKKPEPFHCYVTYPEYVFEYSRVKRLGFPTFEEGVPRLCEADLRSQLRGHIYTDPTKPEPVTLIGKNVGVFDYQFLKRVGLGGICKHRFIDIGNLYLRPDDDVVPGVEECMRRAGMEPFVPHTAKGDVVICMNLYDIWSDRYGATQRT